MTLFALLGAACQAGERETAEEIAQCYGRMVDALGLWPYGKTVAALELALERRDAAETLAALEALLSAMLRPWRMEASPLYRHIAPRPEAAEDAAPPVLGMLPGLLQELEQDPKYAFLREAPAFRELIERYRARCPQTAGEKPTAAKNAWASPEER